MLNFMKVNYILSLEHSIVGFVLLLMLSPKGFFLQMTFGYKIYGQLALFVKHTLCFCIRA